MGGRVIATDDDHAMGVCGHVLVCRWRGHTRASALNAAQTTLARLRAEHPAIGVMHVIEQHAVPPDGAARSATAELIRLGDTALRGTSIVPEGFGFRAALVRGVVTGITMLARLPSPMRVFASVDEAADWHFEHLERMDPAARAALIGFAEELRGALDARG